MGEIKKGSEIEFYMIYQKNIKGEIKGLVKEYKDEDIMISPKFIEKRCLLDYKMVENGNYPIWNFQERGEDWPISIKRQHSDIYRESIKIKK